jgi:hypothetical protein
MLQPPATLPFAVPDVPDVLGLFAWLHKDALIARFETEIAELGDGDDGALDDQQRRDREEEIFAAMLQVERTEEAAIEVVEASGGECRRRDDADPRAVLGLADHLPAAP